MLDLRSVEIRLERAHTDAELEFDGTWTAGSHWSFQGSSNITFDSDIRIVSAAVQAFHLETKDDHHIEKVKVEVSASLATGSRRNVVIGAEAAFRDSSPSDDRYMMRVRVLVIADRA